MPFTEICIYQVKPQKTEEFEALMLEAKSFLEKQEGLLLLRLSKREYHIDMAPATGHADGGPGMKHAVNGGNPPDFREL